MNVMVNFTMLALVTNEEEGMCPRLHQSAALDTFNEHILIEDKRPSWPRSPFSSTAILFVEKQGTSQKF